MMRVLKKEILAKKRKVKLVSVKTHVITVQKCYELSDVEIFMKGEPDTIFALKNPTFTTLNFQFMNVQKCYELFPWLQDKYILNYI